MLAEIHLTETFTGDIDGESTVRALEIRRDDRSASLISLQRVIGKLGAHRGTFVLQGSETVEDGKIKAPGLLCRDQELVVLPDFAVRAALKATSAKDQKERWNIGSNEAFL